MDMTTIAIVMVVLGIAYHTGAISWVVSKVLAVNVPADGQPITGRPILDLVFQAAIEKYKGNPLLVPVLISLAKTIDKLMDDAGIPEVPDLQPPAPK